jgi:hypothetical protein
MRLSSVLLALSLLGNIYLAYKVIDSGVSLTYLGAEQDSLLSRSNDALEIIRFAYAGSTKSEILSLGLALSKQGESYKISDNGNIEIGEVVFELQAEKVSRITYISKY